MLKPLIFALLASPFLALMLYVIIAKKPTAARIASFPTTVKLFNGLLQGGIIGAIIYFATEWVSRLW